MQPRSAILFNIRAQYFQAWLSQDSASVVKNAKVIHSALVVVSSEEEADNAFFPPNAATIEFYTMHSETASVAASVADNDTDDDDPALLRTVDTLQEVARSNDDSMLLGFGATDAVHGIDPHGPRADADDDRDTARCPPPPLARRRRRRS